MSGSGDHFSDKLMRELRTAFALISKSLQTDGIDTELSVQSVIYPTQLPAKNFDVPCEWDTEVTVSNGLSRPRQYYCDSLPLLSPQAELVYQSCQWEAVLVSEPVFSQTDAVLQNVTFENITKPYSADIDIPPVKLQDTIFSIPIPASKTVVYNAPMQKMQKLKETHNLDVTLFKRRTRNFPMECWQLPLLKAPLPPHRFSAEQKAKFRKALSDKAYGENSNMPQSNLQLQAVYDRINLALFASIEQDERGYLKCFPKPEILHNAEAFTRNMPNTYLVMGTRVDTREVIKVLVPMEPV